MTRILYLIPFVVACGGNVDHEPVEVSELLECGALPDLSMCYESDPEAFGEVGNLALVCDGWYDNPFNAAKRGDFFQVVYEDGQRGIVSRINGEAVCLDRWK